MSRPGASRPGFNSQRSSVASRSLSLVLLASRQENHQAQRSHRRRTFIDPLLSPGALAKV